MGAHKGWYCRDRKRPGKTWEAAAWDPGARRYQRRMFASYAAGEAWAKTQHARFRTGQDALPVRHDARRAGDEATLVERYLANMRSRQLSAAHVENATLCLERWQQAVPDPEHPRARVLTQQWVDELVAAGRKPATVDRYLRSVRAFVRWARDHELLAGDPVRLVVAPRVPDEAQPQFQLAELRQMVAARADPYWLRAMVQLYAGLRASEAHNLYWDQVPAGRRIYGLIQWGDQVLMIRGKGGKERLVPIQPELRTILAPSRRQRRTGPLFDDARLWFLSRKQHNQDFRGYLGRLGIPVDGRKPHSFRHSYTGLMTATGVPSLLLASYLGHGSSQTTLGYARLSHRYVRQVAGWPRGEFRLRR